MQFPARLGQRTGGTIDSQPYSDARKPPPTVKTISAEESLVHKVLQNLPPAHTIQYTPWDPKNEERLAKDSKLFTPAALQYLSEFILSCPRQHFILTHGTDSMTRNASLLQDLLKESDKVVVFVGSMVPLVMHPTFPSDGITALQYAVGRIPVLTSGVWVVACSTKTHQWHTFRPHSIEKNRHQSLQLLQLMVDEGEQS